MENNSWICISVKSRKIYKQPVKIKLSILIHILKTSRNFFFRLGTSYWPHRILIFYNVYMSNITSTLVSLLTLYINIIRLFIHKPHYKCWNFPLLSGLKTFYGTKWGTPDKWRKNRCYRTNLSWDNVSPCRRDGRNVFTIKTCLPKDRYDHQLGWSFAIYSTQLLQSVK